MPYLDNFVDNLTRKYNKLIYMGTLKFLKPQAFITRNDKQKNLRNKGKKETIKERNKY